MGVLPTNGLPRFDDMLTLDGEAPTLEELRSRILRGVRDGSRCYTARKELEQRLGKEMSILFLNEVNEYLTERQMVNRIADLGAAGIDVSALVNELEQRVNLRLLKRKVYGTV